MYVSVHKTTLYYVILTLLISEICVAELKTMLRQLAQVLHIKYIHIYDKNEDANLIKYFSRYYIMVVYNAIGFPQDHNRRSLNVFNTLDSQSILHYASYLTTKEMGYHTWVQMNSEDLVRHVPYDFQYFLIKPNGSSEYSIMETYSIKSEMDLYNYFGNWTREAGLQVTHLNLYERRHDLNQTLLTIFEAEDCTFFNTCEEREIWDDMSHMMNFRYKTQSPVNQTGIDCNGIGIPYPILEFDIDTWIWPLVNFELNVFIKAPVLVAGKTTLLMPCSHEMWQATYIWLFVATLIAGLMSLWVTPRPRQFLQMWFTPLDAFCNQDGSMHNQHRAVHRLTTLTSRLLAVVFIPAYSGALTSYLTLRTPVLPFRSLGEMMKGDRFKILYATHVSLAIEYLKILNDTVLDYVVKDNIERFCDGDYAAIQVNRKSSDITSCSSVPLPESAFKVFTAFHLLTRELKGNFNRNAIMFRSAGIISRMHTLRGIHAEVDDKPDYLPVELDHIAIVLIVISTWAFLSCLILVAEIVIYNYSNVNTKNNTRNN